MKHRITRIPMRTAGRNCLSLYAMGLREKRKLFISLCLFTAAFLLPACSKVPLLSPLDPEAKILAFGDSLTLGTGALKGKSYPDFLQQIIDRKVINAGVAGEWTQDGLKRLPHLLDIHRPSLLILFHGANDILQRVEEKRIVRNLEEMIRMAKDREIDVVLIGAPRMSLTLPDAPFYRKIARRHGLPYGEGILGEILKQPQLKYDEVHPNAKGYRLLAERIAALLQDSGAFLSER